MLTVDTYKPGAGSSKDHERQIQTVCRECTAGCGLWAFTRQERIVDVQGDAAHPVNHGRLCARGSEFVHRLARSEPPTQVLTCSRPDEAFAPLEGWESGLG